MVVVVWTAVYFFLFFFAEFIKMGDLHTNFKKQPKGFATKAIHVGQDPEQWTSMAVIPPITTSTTFKQDGPGQHRVSVTPNY